MCVERRTRSRVRLLRGSLFIFCAVLRICIRSDRLRGCHVQKHRRKSIEQMKRRHSFSVV